MPHGCGEQNMVRFAPNIYIQQYLEKSGQLTPEIRDKAQGFLKSGYQRELTYKHNDGSYSAFGKSDATGNTWLTAFVVKCFGQARPYIFIDQQHIEDALKWLQQHQMENGCFQSVGKLLNNALQDPMMSKALQCLHKSSNTTDIYTEFHVDNTNQLVLQQATLPQIPGEYTVTSQGQGCALVQLTLRYNLPPKSATTFDLRVETDPKECTGNARTHFSLILHARYSGGRSATNMAILEVKLPSGYLPDKKSVRKLENEGLVKKLELSADGVILYLDQLTKEETTFTFSVEQDFPVKNLKPATVRLYDYYETAEHTEAEYSAPCSSAPGTEEGNSR
ncbi:murinoglobulin-1 [Alligator sinensis]|uniref:Murinoglobulin-1 n=1 Tax=Alligator sinensis TaxID=38654 RepID=A0A3Q0FW67_ALLSI|nr:murinoglobulin-1 [Alligator sinensis]